MAGLVGQAIAARQFPGAVVLVGRGGSLPGSADLAQWRGTFGAASSGVARPSPEQPGPSAPTLVRLYGPQFRLEDAAPLRRTGS
jgi:hypothetical protein